MKRIIKIKEKNIDKESAIITIKIIVFPIVSFVIIIFGIFFLVGKLNNFYYLPENYRGNTLEYHHEQLAREGFSYLGKTETQGVSKYLAKDIYIYRKKYYWVFIIISCYLKRKMD